VKGSRREGARREGARREGARREGARREGARREGARREGAGSADAVLVQPDAYLEDNNVRRAFATAQRRVDDVATRLEEAAGRKMEKTRPAKSR
jgi:hypothetical protein